MGQNKMGKPAQSQSVQSQEQVPQVATTTPNLMFQKRQLELKPMRMFYTYYYKSGYLLLAAANPKLTSEIVKLAAIGAISLGINYLIFGKLTPQQPTDKINQSQTYILNQTILREKGEVHDLKKEKKGKTVKKDEEWGSVKIIDIDIEDPLMKQLRLMDSLLFEVSRVNNLIVDLELKNFKPFPNYLVATKIKKDKDQPYLSEETLVPPGQFLLRQCRFTPGNTLELEQKFLRSGPRASSYFNHYEVRADIVCLGAVCPGINTVIREITIMLKSLYKVEKVTGVKNSFKGYYDKTFVDLTEKNVETIHHNGGCFLSQSRADLIVGKVIESLVQRKVNQLYLIGANNTMKACQALHEEIKKRKLSIAVCVLLKGINHDIPIFDSCFGFETAVEESSKVIEKAYAYSHSHENGISLVKLPGQKSGFLSSYSVLSTVNANVCLVPQFEFDMFGPKGLLTAILWRLKHNGNCTIVYSEGVENCLRDCCIPKKSASYETITEFDNFFRKSIEDALKSENLVGQIGIFNSVEISRASPANSFDTKLCCQISQASIQGMMAGYTNFAVGHFASKSAMISVDELILSGQFTTLKEHDDIWQQTIMTTGQPRLLNDEYVIRNV